MSGRSESLVCCSWFPKLAFHHLSSFIVLAGEMQVAVRNNVKAEKQGTEKWGLVQTCQEAAGTGWLLSVNPHGALGQDWCRGWHMLVFPAAWAALQHKVVLILLRT